MMMPQPQVAVTLSHLVLAQLATGADWLGTWWPAAALTAVTAVSVVVAVRPGHRAGRLRRRLAGVVGAAIALMLASGFAVNAAVGYVPNVSAAWLLLAGHSTSPRAGSGQISATAVVTVSAQAGTGQVTAAAILAPPDLRIPASTTWVYTPPGYDPAGRVRYPVVYLIHGTPGQSSDWFTGGDIAHVMDVLIAAHQVRPMIIVAPDVNGVGQGDTECLDSTRGGSKVETYLSSVVVPWVDAHYATRADWPHRVIGGMSSGGFCALDQGLRHPELYGSIIALEPFGDPGSGGRAMLGTKGQFDAHSPAHYLRTMTFAHPVPTFLDIGGLGGGGQGSHTAPLAAHLRARGQVVLSRMEPNLPHNWTMARTGIPYGLVFVSDHLPA